MRNSMEWGLSVGVYSDEFYLRKEKKAFRIHLICREHNFCIGGDINKQEDYFSLMYKRPGGKQLKAVK